MSVSGAESRLNPERGDTDLSSYHVMVVLSKSIKDGTVTAVTELCERKETRYCKLLLPTKKQKNVCIKQKVKQYKNQHKKR